MVQVNELRVGNWFLDAFSGPLQVRREDIENWEAINSMPILITPEILEKAGFIRTEDEEGNTHYDHPNCSIDFQAGVGSNIFEQVNPYLPYKLEFLHQLQNLHFALTGEELNIKPWYKYVN